MAQAATVGAVGERITLVLPVDDGPSRVLVPAAGLGVAGLAGATVGVVDNGLWASMRVLVDELGARVAGAGGAGLSSTPFDHLARDFAAQQAALVPFAASVRAAVAGLGN